MSVQKNINYINYNQNNIDNYKQEVEKNEIISIPNAGDVAIPKRYVKSLINKEPFRLSQQTVIQDNQSKSNTSEEQSA